MITALTQSFRRLARASIPPLLLVSWLLASAGEARAERVAVAPFTGPRAASFQRAATAGIGKRHTVVSSARYRKAARRLKARKPTGRNVKRVGARLKVDGVLIGSVKKRGGSYQLQLWLRSTATGKVVAKTSVTSKRPRLSKRQQRKLGRELSTMLAKLPASGSRSAGKRVAKKRSGKGDGKRTVRDHRSKKSKRGQASGRSRGKRVATRPDQSARKSANKSARRPASSLTGGGPATGSPFDLGAGLGVTSRHLAFDVADGVLDLPQSYRGNPLASVHVAGAVYPMAFIDKQRTLRSRFAVTGGYDRVLLIESRLQYDDIATGDPMQLQLPTEHSEWHVGVLYRQLFGQGERPVALYGSLSVHHLTFAIERADLPLGAEVELPDVGYTYLDPGVAAHVPITDKISADAGADFILVVGRGAIGDDESYGAGSALGYRARLAVQYDLRFGLSARLSASWMSIHHSFEGTGTESNMRDGDPATVDVPSARDRFISVQANASYQF